MISSEYGVGRILAFAVSVSLGSMILFFVASLVKYVFAVNDYWRPNDKATKDPPENQYPNLTLKKSKNPTKEIKFNVTSYPTEYSELNRGGYQRNSNDCEVKEAETLQDAYVVLLDVIDFTALCATQTAPQVRKISKHVTTVEALEMKPHYDHYVHLLKTHDMRRGTE